MSLFEDSPAIIRTPQMMKQYYDFDYAMQPHLDSAGAGPSKPSRLQPNGSSGLHLSLGVNGGSNGGFLSLDGAGSTNTVGELQSQLESAVKLEESDSATLSRTYQECLTTGAIRGPKRYARFWSDTYGSHYAYLLDFRMPQNELDFARAPKRRKILLTPDQIETQAALVKDNDLLGAWWGAVASSTFIGNGVPPLPLEPPLPQNRSRLSSETHDKTRQKLKGKHGTYVA